MSDLPSNSESCSIPEANGEMVDGTVTDPDLPMESQLPNNDNRKSRVLSGASQDRTVDPNEASSYPSFAILQYLIPTARDIIKNHEATQQKPMVSGTPADASVDRKEIFSDPPPSAYKHLVPTIQQLREQKAAEQRRKSEEHWKRFFIMRQMKSSLPQIEANMMVALRKYKGSGKEEDGLQFDIWYGGKMMVEEAIELLRGGYLA
ncbi:MAG: hypothetical protein LQ338_006225 [Usnochroma carphineum]|nr:MAG: hypothetical protein LQ338_006225 [Usnochroma carphineum]